MDKLAVPPPADEESSARRRNEIGHLATELESRGFDTEALIKTVGGGIVAGSVVLSVVIPLLVVASGGEPDNLPRLPSHVGDAWGELLFTDGLSLHEREARAATSGDDWVRETAATAFSHLMEVNRSLSTGTAGRIVNWTPPTTDELTNIGPPPPVDKVQGWIVDRFTTTYLDRWQLDSLHLEWQWLHGERRAPCDPREMRARRVEPATLDASIAARSTSQDEKMPAPAANSDRYVEPALQMLREGRRSAAAAIFEAVIQVAPDDARAYNNHGFCLLIDDPEKALRSLEAATARGLATNSMNVGNRMFALARVGRPATALDVAERFFSARSSDGNPDGAYMWDFDSDEPSTTFVSSSQLYVCDFARHLALRNGDEMLAELWSDRVTMLRAEAGG
ncbi:MAG TPA: hypothetical protein VM938_02585 [Acidimicrobiales bacterium]|nr:hypothetical protein [Acidimicrobiales bacterium]